MKKVFRKLHLWLSLPAGIVITLMCLTGAILVFDNEILELCYPERYHVRDNGEGPLPLDEVLDRAQAGLQGDTIVSIQVFNDPGRTYMATLASGARAYMFIDPHTAEIKGYWNAREDFFAGVTRLHRWLMFKDRMSGKLITGISTIFFVLILLSGIGVWWPKKTYKNHFVIKWKSNFARRMYDLHCVLGVYATIFLLTLCLTGLMWSFQWYRDFAGKVFGVEQVVDTASGNRPSGGDRAGGRDAGRSNSRGPEPSMVTLTLEEKLQAAKKAFPTYSYVRIDLRKPTVTVLRKEAAHERATDQYRFNREGALEPVKIYGQVRDKSYLMLWAYAIHVGSWGGWFTKLLTLIAALIGASLPITGYVMYFRKILKNKERSRISK